MVSDTMMDTKKIRKEATNEISIGTITSDPG